MISLLVLPGKENSPVSIDCQLSMNNINHIKIIMYNTKGFWMPSTYVVDISIIGLDISIVGIDNIISWFGWLWVIETDERISWMEDNSLFSSVGRAFAS